MSQKGVFFVLAATATLAMPTIASGQSRCASYRDAVEVTGRLERRTYPGPPNYTSIDQGDEAETSFYLVLARPICTQGTDTTPDEQPLSRVELVQLVLDSVGYAHYRASLGQMITVNGMTFSASTGHHHAPLLLVPVSKRKPSQPAASPSVPLANSPSGQLGDSSSLQSADAPAVRPPASPSVQLADSPPVLGSIWTGIRIFFQWQSLGILLLLVLGDGALRHLVGTQGPDANVVSTFAKAAATSASEVLLVAIATWILAPVMLGVSPDAAWFLPLRLLLGQPLWVAKVVAILVLVDIGVTFIPVFGRVPTLGRSIVAMVALAHVTSFALMADTMPGPQMNYWPGIGTALAFLTAGALTVIPGMALSFLFVVVAPLMLGTPLRDDSRAPKIVGAIVGSFFGLLPVFFYGAWLGAQRAFQL